MKPRIKSMMWNIRNQKTANQNNKKKKESKNMRKSSLWDNFKHSNICIMGMPEGKRESKELKTCLKKIMTIKFPNLVKEIGIQV